MDALTTMLDETIPLTVIEWEEWGNPGKGVYGSRRGRPGHAARPPHCAVTRMCPVQPA